MPARLWYISGFETHGVPGLAEVYDGLGSGLAGQDPKPDMDLVGTEHDCARFLKAYGFREVLTDNEPLLRAWKEVNDDDNDGGRTGADPGSIDGT